MKTMFKKQIVFLAAVTCIVSCSKSTDQSTSSGSSSASSAPTIGGGVPDVYKKIYNAISVSVDGSYIVIKTNGLPDHKSPYYKGTQWASTMYEAYNGSNTAWSQNPNTISSQSLTFRIPASPSVAATHVSTPLGPMGVAVNGVPIFNQYAAGGSPLTGEVNSFDQYDGHPQQSGQYHYHAEPWYITTNKGKDALVGFLLDGFPVYGPVENGVTLGNSDLDKYHGHFSKTADYPNGIYHYHITSADPYINGDGFYGTAGTVTN